MEETVFKSDDLLVMNLINYFITENGSTILFNVLSKENSNYKIEYCFISFIWVWFPFN